MGKQKFTLKLNMDHKHANNAHVTGRILGIAEIMCDLFGGVKERTDNEGTVHNVKTFRGGWYTDRITNEKYLKVTCTAEQYEKFRDYIEIWYPGLLTYDDK